MLGLHKINGISLFVKSPRVKPRAVPPLVPPAYEDVVEALAAETQVLALHQAVDHREDVLVGLCFDEILAEEAIPEELVLAALPLVKEFRGGAQGGDLLNGQGEVVVVGEVEGVGEKEGF